MTCLKALLITVRSIDQKLINEAFDNSDWFFKIVHCDAFVSYDLLRYIDDEYDWVFIDTTINDKNLEDLKPDNLMFQLKKSMIKKGFGVSVFDSSKSTCKVFDYQEYFSQLAQSIYLAHFPSDSDIPINTDILRSLEYRGVMRFQSPVLARTMSLVLANFSCDPDRLSLGLWEMFMNGIEHGNLGIDHDTKKKYVHDNNMDDLVQEKLQIEENKNKFVQVSYIISSKRAIFDIKDEGKGFDWLKFWDIDHSRMFDKCGRGIALARMMAFDHVAYLGNGNNVICSSDFKQDEA